MKRLIFNNAYRFISFFFNGGVWGPIKYQSRDLQDVYVDSLLSRHLAKRDSISGVSAVFRVKNAADTIIPCVMSVVPLCNEIIIVDNGSSDDTYSLCLQLKEKIKNSEVKIYRYDYEMARAGEKYESDLLNGKMSLADFYNFCFSKATGEYVYKADAHKMTLPSSILAIQNRIELKKDVIWFRGVEVFGHNLNFEPYIYKRSLNCYYKDGENFEYLVGTPSLIRSFLTDFSSIVLVPAFVHFKRIFYVR